MRSNEEEKFVSCSFCVLEKKIGDLYKCPKCTKLYCSLRCYKSRKHAQCSERFYEVQCRMEAGEQAEEVPASVSRPTTTFDEYMDSKSGEQKGLTEDQINPKIAVNNDEEILFDSDDEPEYLKNVIDSTMKQFETMESDELNRQLLLAGLPLELGQTGELNPEHFERLYSNLNDEEKRAFTRLADEIFSNEIGNNTCFKSRPKNKK